MVRWSQKLNYELYLINNVFTLGEARGGGTTLTSSHRVDLEMRDIHTLFCDYMRIFGPHTNPTYNRA